MHPCILLSNTVSPLYSGHHQSSVQIKGCPHLSKAWDIKFVNKNINAGIQKRKVPAKLGHLASRAGTLSNS